MTQKSEKTECSAVEKIIKAAAGEFASEGFAGARVDVIARKAGVNKATIYYHIGDKAALYSRVLSEVVGGIAEQIKDIDQKSASPQKRLTIFISTISEKILSSGYFAPIILREIASGGATMPKDVLKLMGQILITLRSILEDGREKGSLKETNLMLTHLMIVGGINFMAAGMPVFRKVKSAGLADSDYPSGQSYDQIGEQMAGLLLHGMKACRHGGHK